MRTDIHTYIYTHTNIHIHKYIHIYAYSIHKKHPYIANMTKQNMHKIYFSVYSSLCGSLHNLHFQYIKLKTISPC